MPNEQQTYAREQLRVVCSWCDAVLEAGDPGAPTSHGLCQACADQQWAEYLAQKEQRAAIADGAALWAARLRQMVLRRVGAVRRAA